MKTDRTWRKIAILAIAPIGVIIVVASLAYLSQIKFRERMVFQTQQQLLTIARTTARSVDEFIAAHSEALQTVARDTLLQEEKGGKILRLLKKSQYSPLEAFYDIHKKDIDALCLLDQNGTILSRYPSVTGVEKKLGVSLAARPDVAYVLREHKPSISRTSHNSSGSLVVSILEPVFYRDQFKGIIQRIISTDTLSRRFIEPVKLRGKGCVWMFDDDNIILSYPYKEFVGSSVLDVVINMHLERGETFDEDRLSQHILEDHDYLNKVKVEDDGFGMFVDCNHIDELVAYKKVAIGEGNLYLVVSLPYYEIVGPINNHARNMFSLAGMVILLFGVGGAFFLKTQKRKAELETEAKYLKEIARSAEALRESERRLRDLVESSLTGIFIVQDNRIVFKNPEQERLFGPFPEDFRFADFKNVHPDDEKAFRRFYERVLSGDVQALDAEVRFHPMDKPGTAVNMRWVHCRATSVKYEGKEAVLVNMMDITRAKELEQMVLMKQKMTSLGHVAAGIAHEIRNPLSGINIHLTTLQRMFQDLTGPDHGKLEKSKDIIDQLQTASNKIESVIRRVMDFSKPSQPKLVLTDINESIEEAISLSLVTMRKTGIKVDKSLSRNLPACYADRHLIGQVILNLITNAAQAMEEGEGQKKIEIASSEEGNSVVIRISDSGPGVPPDLRDKVFDPFFTTKSDSPGIGLSLSHRIVTDHGGTLDVTTSKWGGAEFRLSIPVKGMVENT